MIRMPSLVWWSEVAFEPLNLANVELGNDAMAVRQEAREPHRPEPQIAVGETTDLGLEVLRHVIIVIAFIAESAQQIKHPRASILALLA